MIDRKITLSQSELPQHWYNILADLDSPLPPPLNPQTKEPLQPQELTALFSQTCIEQEVSTDRTIDIPEEVREVYSLWRPTPLYRAVALERALGTPAKIYYKYEGVSPSGSHKANTAVAQAYYHKIEGTKQLTTETGAGQWGSALSFACCAFNIDLLVYMVRISYEQKPYRRSMIELYGAQIYPSPSERTSAGQAALARNANTPGTLGIAISEAIEEAMNGNGTKYALGSVLNHVLLHQTVIGLEAIDQMEKTGDYPDVIIGCVGGGSNFAGLALPFIADAKRRARKVNFIAVEPTACPTLTTGEVRYDFGDAAQTTPLLYMHTLGHDFTPPGIHAGGLRYHGMAPIISLLVEKKIVQPIALNQSAIFNGSVFFARHEGIIPAPEAGYAVRAAIDIAQECTKTGKERVILFNLSGHGHFDMAAYNDYFSGKLVENAQQEASILQRSERLLYL